MIKDIYHQSSILGESLMIKSVLPTAVGIERVLIFLHGKLKPERDYSIIE